MGIISGWRTGQTGPIGLDRERNIAEGTDRAAVPRAGKPGSVVRVVRGDALRAPPGWRSRIRWLGSATAVCCRCTQGAQRRLDAQPALTTKVRSASKIARNIPMY